MISFNERVNGDSFIFRTNIAFSGDHKRDLGGLKVEVSGGENSDHGKGWISVIISTIFGFDVSIEITLGNSVGIDIW